MFSKTSQSPTSSSGSTATSVILSMLSQVGPQSVVGKSGPKAEGAGGDKGAGIAVFRADLKRDAAAGMLFLIHGKRATYHVGWTSEEGRTNAAHNLILWTAMKDLKARGVKVLDLGGVNTQSGAGIARFKLEAGGKVLSRAGAFV